MNAFFKLQAFHSLLGEDSQIFSDDEQVETFELFEKEFAEEQDEQLQFLMELQTFKREYPEEFRKIQNLPHKTRNAVCNDQLNQQSLVFLKNQHRLAFYQVSPNLQEPIKPKTTETTFVQTAKTLKAQIFKHTLHTLPHFHYPHVQAAKQHFDNENVQQTQEDPAFNKQENKALFF